MMIIMIKSITCLRKKMALKVLMMSKPCFICEEQNNQLNCLQTSKIKVKFKQNLSLNIHVIQLQII